MITSQILVHCIKGIYHINKNSNTDFGLLYFWYWCKNKRNWLLFVCRTYKDSCGMKTRWIQSSKPTWQEVSKMWKKCAKPTTVTFAWAPSLSELTVSHVPLCSEAGRPESAIYHYTLTTKYLIFLCMIGIWNIICFFHGIIASSFFQFLGMD